jgi:hypothetical protein
MSPDVVSEVISTLLSSTRGGRMREWKPHSYEKRSILSDDVQRRDFAVSGYLPSEGDPSLTVGPRCDHDSHVHDV